MRASFLGIGFALLVGTAAAFGQDPGLAAIQASEQAAQQAQQASQQSMQAAQQASDQAMQAAQNATAGNLACVPPAPTFSVKSGTYAGPQTVLLKDRARQAAVYYSTEGWTPTFASLRFAAPVSITSTTVLTARAFSANCGWGPVAAVTLTLPGEQAAVPPPVVVGQDAVLRAGTALVLRFTEATDSSQARVGDLLHLVVASPITWAGQTLPPGTLRATAYITAVHPARFAGDPGELEFALHDVQLAGQTVALAGHEIADGQDRYREVRHRLLIPVLGLSGLGIRGDEAVVAAGAMVTGTVAKDTPLVGGTAEKTMDPMPGMAASE